jgi:hypothetical protein
MRPPTTTAPTLRKSLNMQKFSERESWKESLLEIFNKTARREIKLVNERIIDPDQPHLMFKSISNLNELDQITDPVFNYAKAKVLKHIGEKNGFKVQLEESNASPSVYAKFTKVDDDGVTDFKIRISDHADVSNKKPEGEKKAYDINPDSNGSMQEIINLLDDQNWLKQFHQEDLTEEELLRLTGKRT